MADWRPRISPVSSVTLLVVSPRNPASSPRIFPLESLSTAPNPADPGFPLEAPSKFTLMKRSGGGVQLVGLVGAVCGGFAPSCLLKIGCQFCRMPRSTGLHCRSSAVQDLLLIVSLMRDFMVSQVTVGWEDWERKILLFRSFQICQRMNPGRSCQIRFSMGLL